MKNLKLLIAIATVLVLSGCVQRVSLDVEENNIAEKEQMEILLTASFSDVVTRAYPSSVDEMRKARINFEGLRIVFYQLDSDIKSSTVAYTYDCDINAHKGVLSGKDFIQSDNTDSKFRIKIPFKINRGHYHIYIIAGATEAIKSATSVGQPFKLMQSAIVRDEKEFYTKGYLKNSIYINSNPLIISEKEPSISTLSDHTYALDECVLAPINAFASVNWSPVIHDNRFVISNNSILVFADVLNKKFILLPKYDQQVKTELGIDFPIDPNYSNFGSKEMDLLEPDFLYHPFYNQDGSEKFTFYYSSKDDRENSYLIIPENTMDAKDYWGTVVTRLIVMAMIYPKDMNLGDADINSIRDRSKLPSWVYFKDNGFSEAEFDALYKKSNESETKTDEDIDIITAYRELKGSRDQYPKNGYQSKSIRYYKHGTSFFSIPIQHFTEEQLKGKSAIPGLYAVVRNTHYNIVIKSFQGVGAASMESLSKDLNYKDIMNATTGDLQIVDANVIDNIIDTLY